MSPQQWLREAQRPASLGLVSAPDRVPVSPERYEQRAKETYSSRSCTLGLARMALEDKKDSYMLHRCA